MTLTQSIEFPGKLPWLANLVLVLVLIWVISSWFASRDWLEPVQSQSTIMQQTLPALSELQGSLFGKAGVQPTAPKSVVKAVVKSRLNIKLLGTVVAADNSAAVIAVAGKSEEQVVFVGGMLQQGVRLHQVLEDAIVVDRGGSLENIMMDKSGGLVPSPMQQSLQPVAPATPSEHRFSSRPPLPAGGSGEFMTLLSQARVTPHFVNGKAEGFMVSNIVPGSVYEQAGVRNGDVVRKVNGQAISNAQQAMAMYQSLQKGGSIDIELLRAGQLRQLHYDFVRP